MGEDSAPPAPPPTGGSVLQVLHFNDVYEVAQRVAEPVGGAPRFQHALRRMAAEHAPAGPTVVLFSGDALSPSLMSTITRGKHMVPILNDLRVGAACLGNHDLDFSVSDFKAVAAQHGFPWLCANVTERATGRPLGDCAPYTVLTAGDWRVGVLGLVESEWIATLATVDASSVRYEDYVECAARLVPVLRGAERCDVVIALTHMRVPNDLRLAAACAAPGGPAIDLLLGGHDHDYHTEGLLTPAQQAQVRALGPGGWAPPLVPLVKSGSDFRTLSRIRLSRSASGLHALGPLPPRLPDTPGAPEAPIGVYSRPGGGSGIETSDLPPLAVDVHRVDITSAEPEDAGMAGTVGDFVGVLARKLEQVIGVSRVPLDSRFEAIRTRETAAGNLICDLMRQAVDADVAILNSGTLRADALLRPGLLRLRDLVSLLPMQDSSVKLRMPGRRVLEALENSVAMWPAREGRFAQVSGIRFAFDPSRPPGQRVVRSSVMVMARRRPASTVAAVSTAAAATPAAATTAPPAGVPKPSPAAPLVLPAQLQHPSLLRVNAASAAAHAAAASSSSPSAAGGAADDGSSAGGRTPFDVERVAIEDAATPVTLPSTPSTAPGGASPAASASGDHARAHGHAHAASAPQPPPAARHPAPSMHPTLSAAALLSPQLLHSMLPHGYATHIHDDEDGSGGNDAGGDAGDRCARVGDGGLSPSAHGGPRSPMAVAAAAAVAALSPPRRDDADGGSDGPQDATAGSPDIGLVLDVGFPTATAAATAVATGTVPLRSTSTSPAPPPPPPVDTFAGLTVSADDTDGHARHGSTASDCGTGIPGGSLSPAGCLSPGQSALDAGLRITSLLPLDEEGGDHSGHGHGDGDGEGGAGGTEGAAAMWRVSSAAADLGSAAGAASAAAAQARHAALGHDGFALSHAPPGGHRVRRAESAPSDALHVTDSLQALKVGGDTPSLSSSSGGSAAAPSTSSSTGSSSVLSPSTVASDPSQPTPSSSAATATRARGAPGSGAAGSLPPLYQPPPAPLPNPLTYEVTSTGAVVKRSSYRESGDDGTPHAAPGSAGGSPVAGSPAVSATPSPAPTSARSGVPSSSGNGGSGPVWLPLEDDALYTVATKSCELLTRVASQASCGVRRFLIPTLFSPTPPALPFLLVFLPLFTDLSHGKDGYTCFAAPDVEVLIGEENGPILPTLLRNHFRVLSALSGWGSLDVDDPTSPARSLKLRPRPEGLRRVLTKVALAGSSGGGTAAAGGDAAGDGDAAAGIDSGAGGGDDPADSRAPLNSFDGRHAHHPHPHRHPHHVPRYSLAIAPVVDGRITVVTPATGGGGS